MSSPAAPHPAVNTATGLPVRPLRPGPHEVATMLDTLAAADRHLADVLDTIGCCRARVSPATVRALERVLATLRPATDIRARLTRVDRQVLAAAIRLRRERGDTNPAGPTTSSGGLSHGQH